LPNCTNELELGMDFMKNHCVVIDTKSDLITFDGSATKPVCIERTEESVENFTLGEYCNLPSPINRSKASLNV